MQNLLQIIGTKAASDPRLLILVLLMALSLVGSIVLSLVKWDERIFIHTVYANLAAIIVTAYFGWWH